MAKLKTQFNDLVSSPTPYSQIVEISGSQEDGFPSLVEYEGYTIELTITGIHDDQINVELPKNCYLIIKLNADHDGGWLLATNRSVSVIFGFSSNSAVNWTPQFNCNSTTNNHFVVINHIAVGLELNE
jgi:hypothetical protein